jgi:tripartite-type tricarboxylate transporter receptor subunit TctC
MSVAARGALALVFAAVAVPATLHAAAGIESTYPSRPIRVIDAFAAGGGTDIMARLIGQRLSERFKQSIVVDNRPGAGGNVGAEIAAKASPDGHTLFMAALPALAPSATLYPKLPYDAMRDFTYVTLVASGTYVLFVQPALPVKSVADLITLAKSMPAKLSYGSTGVGGPAHLAGELFKSRAGVDILHVAYKGTPPILAAVSSGEVHLGYLTLAGVLPAWKAGRINALAVTSAKRVKGAPELSTIAESGLPGYDVTPWYGILVPAGTANAIVKYMNTEIARVLQSSDIQEKLAVQGLEATPSTPEHFRRLMQTEIDKWAKVIKQAGIKAQ